MKTRWTRLRIPVLIFCISMAVWPPDTGNAFSDGRSDGTVSGKNGVKLNQYLTRLSRFGFSGAVLVAQRGKILLHKGYGWADQQHGEANTAQTVFDIASLTKQFTAAAILKLEADGKLKTGDRISQYLPDVPPDKAEITIHHLLTHTSGFDPDFTEGKGITRNQFIAAMLKMPLVAKPGKQFIYANSGYCLLAAIIEIVSAQPYNQFLVEKLYKPAGLTHTGCYDDAARWSQASIAHGYNEATDNGLPTARPSNWGVRGAYDALTTVGDFYKWVTALRNHSVLPEAQVKKLFSPQAPADEPGVNYGYGWLIGKSTEGKTLIKHDGSHFEGFNASCKLYLDDDLVVIVMANRIFGRLLPQNAIEPAIAGILFHGKTPEVPEAISIGPALLKKVVGTYHLPSGARIEVGAEKDHLTVSPWGQEAIDLLLAATPEERNRHAEFNGRAAAIFHGIAKGDYSALDADLKRKEILDEFKAAAAALWRKFEAAHGAFKSLDLLGTVPETEATMTYVQLNFERGSEYRRCRWEQGKLGYILLGAPPLIPTSFVPQSERDFAGYHVVIGRTCHIRFKDDSKAAPSLLVLSGTGSVLATATKQ